MPNPSSTRSARANGRSAGSRLRATARSLPSPDVDDATGKVTEAWTGFQVPWTMARGYAGAFGRISNALYIWLPLCALFLAPFMPWRRPFRRSSWSLLHLDLVMLLGFSISLAFFNHAKIGLSVPLVYPFLVYLLGRLLALARGARAAALALSRRIAPLAASGALSSGRVSHRSERDRLERDRRGLCRRDRGTPPSTRSHPLRRVAHTTTPTAIRMVP